MTRLDDIRGRLELARLLQTDDETLLDDIEYLLNHIDRLEDCVIVYKLGEAKSRITLDVVSKGEGSGYSRYDWFGESDE